MSNVLTFSPATTKKYLKAILEAGFEPGGIEITADGTLRVLSPSEARQRNDAGDSEYEQFLEQKFDDD